MSPSVTYSAVEHATGFERRNYVPGSHCSPGALREMSPKYIFLPSMHDDDLTLSLAMWRCDAVKSSWTSDSGPAAVCVSTLSFFTSRSLSLSLFLLLLLCLCLWSDCEKAALVPAALADTLPPPCLQNDCRQKMLAKKTRSVSHFCSSMRAAVCPVSCSSFPYARDAFSSRQLLLAFKIRIYKPKQSKHCCCLSCSLA